MKIALVIATCILATTALSYGQPSKKADGSHISVNMQEINPFEPDQKIAFVRIGLSRSTDDKALAYTINDRVVNTQALDGLLVKLAKIDRNQIITVELGPDVSVDDLSTLVDMLKTHEFKHVARRGEDNTAIWIMK